MNLGTIARYLFGNEQAIRAIAANRGALWTGIILVLLTAVARNYDQNFFLETPLWLFGPLLFSLFSGSILWELLYDGFIKRHFAPDSKPARSQQWRSFMGLFWLTAPIAWLYAIPVERFLDSYTAAQANIALLAIVSAWRVLLMSRVISVVHGVPAPRALTWVIFAAAIEVIVVVFLGMFFGGGLSKRILAGMSGMRNSPEENLLSSVLGTVWTCSWVFLAVTALLLAIVRYRGETTPLPVTRPGRMPWLPLAMLVAVWIVIAWPGQKEQKTFLTHAKLMSDERYADALAYLARHQQKDFPASRRLEPNPYEYRVWEDLPPTIALFTTNTPLWIRQLYLGYASVTLTHHWLAFRSITNVALMVQALEAMPEGREWLLTNQTALAEKGFLKAHRPSADDTNTPTIILNTLERIGVAKTNLARFRDDIR